MLEHIEWLVLALAALLAWVGRMSWSASRTVVALELRLASQEREMVTRGELFKAALAENAAECERKRQETQIAMQRESALAIKDIMLEIAQELGKIGSTQAVQGEMIKSVKEDVEAIFKRLNRRATDRAED